MPIVKSVWVTEHYKMPKLERAFKWREIVYARLTLTDLANVKQLSWATRATIIIGDAHFQVGVERGDILKKKERKMFHLVSRSARTRKIWRFPDSCFHNDRYNLDILDSLNCLARGKKISAETLVGHRQRCSQRRSRCISAVTRLSGYSDADNWFMCKCLGSLDGSQSI